jgi:signal transduction histidine kinase
MYWLIQPGADVADRRVRYLWHVDKAQVNKTPARLQSPLLVDAAIAGGATITLLLLAVIATEEGSRPPDAVAYMLAALIGVVLLGRRRYPTGVAVLSFLLVFVYHSLDYPAIGNMALAFALFNASYQSATLAASVIAAVAVAGSLGWFLVGEQRPLTEAFNFAVRELGVMAAAILTGSVLRSRRLLAEQTQEQIRQARADEEAQAERLRVEERMAIAREIHDVVAHTVAVIGVQARAAADSLQDGPSEVEGALRVISESTREATAELRATISLLRGGELSTAPVPRLDQLETLVESVATSGLDVEVRVTGEQRRLSGLVELVAYRVVQEALTNVVKHARATSARVELDYRRGELRLAVSDDGVGGQPSTGHGIVGMRERVEATGGSLSIGPSPDGGLQVAARIPTGARQ